MLDALLIASARPSSQTGDLTRTDPACLVPSGARSATTTAPTSTAQTFREITHTGSAVPLQIDTIVRTSEPTQFDLRAAAVRFGSSAGATIRTTPNPGEPSPTPVCSRTTAAQRTGWVKTAGNFAKGFGEGARDAGGSMVRGVADIAKGGYGFATDARVRATILGAVPKGTVGGTEFAKTAAVDPVKISTEVGMAVQSAWNHISSAYEQASASGHGAEFIGKAVGQGAVLAATLPIPGGAEAGSVAEIGVAARAAEAAGDFARESDAQTIAGGHAWTEHQAEFPGWNQSGFTKVVHATVQNPDGEKTLSRGRTAYWNEQEKLVVIRDPQNPDSGTAFRPKSGKSYFDLGLK